MRKVRLMIVALASVVWTFGYGQVCFRWISPNGVDAAPQAVSRYGDKVVGLGGPNGGDIGFIWDEAGGFRRPPADAPPLIDLSDDGVYYAGLGGGPSPRWLSPSEDIRIASLGRAAGISSDGQAVLWHTDLGRSYIWQHGVGSQEITSSLGGYAEVQDFSHDGQWIVGGRYTNGPWVAFRWRPGTGLQDLGELPGGSTYSYAKASNGDGSVIVGRSAAAGGYRAFRWSEAAGMVDLGLSPLGGNFSEALDVSEDGNVIVGTSATGAIVWTPATGTVDLRTLLLQRGWIDTDTVLTAATAVSGDGTTVAGYAGNWTSRRAFVARIFGPWPTSFNVSPGYVVDGSLSSLYCADGARLVVFPDEQTLDATVTVNSVCPTLNPPKLLIRVVSSVGRLALAQAIKVRNYAAGTIQTVDGRVAPTTETTIEILLENAGNYVGPNGAMQVRIQWNMINDEAPSQDGWAHSLDEVSWSVRN